MPMPEDMGYFRRNLEKRRFHTIAGFVPRSGLQRVLDAGAGSGWLSEILSERGLDVHSLDLGFDSIKRASQRIRLKKGGYGTHGETVIQDGGKTGKAVCFTLGDVYRLPYGDGSFDAVVASEIIEHLDIPEKAFHEVYRVLQPKGFLIVLTPYNETIEQTLCIHFNEKIPVNHNLHTFDESSMGKLLVNSGFSVQRVMLFINRPAERIGLAGMTGFLPHPLWRLIDTALCRSLGKQTYMVVKAVRTEV